jgi:hypothetical protein
MDEYDALGHVSRMLYFRLLAETMITYWADASSKHTLADRPDAVQPSLHRTTCCSECRLPQKANLDVVRSETVGLPVGERW